MRDCRETRTLAVGLGRLDSRPARARALCAVVACGWVAVAAAAAHAQHPGILPELDGGVIDGVVPYTESGGGDFFSQELGTLLRVRYSTESYGQDQSGNLDIGTMRVANFNDAIAFIDAQVTLNDVQGVGFNAGVGFRWIGWTPFPLEPERINGFNFWVDGTSTESGNFFPQIGVGYESLGDMWDFRANTYIPVGSRSQVGAFVATGDIVFQENFLVTETVADRNTSLTGAEMEFARRLGPDRDAWAFAGPYVLANDDTDTAGYRIGVRGYAYPDLLLQFAVTDDDIFKTNATFSFVWFIGRTRTDFQPACGLPDRMREPVMRNDYVVLAKDQVRSGMALTNTDGDAFRFVHVDSSAAGGGDGSFENPLNDVGEVNGNSLAGDIVLLYSDSVFDMQNSLVLQDRQRLLGEGNDMTFQITTRERGVIDIPETSPGSREGARPIILDAIGDAIVLADQNEVANIEIDGATGGGIVAGPDGAGSPNLHDLVISNTTDNGIELTPFVRDNDGIPATPARTVAFNVNINNVMFENIGGNNIDIDAESGEDLGDPNVTLQEAITISNITSTDGDGIGLFVRNTHGPGTLAVSNFNHDGGTTSTGGVRFEDIAGDVLLTNVDVILDMGIGFDFANVATTTAVTINGGSSYDGGTGTSGGMRFDNYDGTLNVSSTTLTDGLGAGVAILGGSDGTFTFQDTFSIDSVDGTAFDVDGFTGVLTMNGEITNDTGQSVSIQNASMAGTSLTFSGDITDTLDGEGIFIGGNSNGTILFSGDIMLNLTNSTAIQLTSNTGADISFSGELDIMTQGGANGFEATGGGTLTVSGVNNSISTNGGVGLLVTGMTISNAGVNFASLDVMGATNGVVLMNNTGGPITVGTLGDDAGESGTILGTTMDAIVIDNSANVTISGLQIDSAAGQSGVSVNKTTAGTQTVNLNDLEINGGAIGVEVTGNGTGTLNMTVNDTLIDTPTSIGLSVDNIDAGNIQVNGTTIDGNGTTATAGVLLTGSNASFTFNSQTEIREVIGTAFEVDGGNGNVSVQGDITNTAGQSVHIHDRTGGNVNFTSSSSITDSGAGIHVEDNSGGSVSFLGTNDLTVSGTDTAVRLANNTGATMTFASLDIEATGAARGFWASGGGTLSVTGPNNMIETDTGIGLEITDMIIGSVDFANVTVTGGTTNGIVLQNLTGGQVAIGTLGGAPNSGGALTTTGDAIVLTNVANVDLRHIEIVDSTGGRGIHMEHQLGATNAMDVTILGLNLIDSSGAGINVAAANNTNNFNLRLVEGNLEERVAIAVTGQGDFALLVDSTDIVTTGADVAFELSFSGSARNGDVTFRNDNNFLAADASALSVTTAGATAKTIHFHIDGTSNDNTFRNDDADAAGNFLIGGNTLFRATIQGNIFDNANAGGEDFVMTATGAQSRVRLNLGGDQVSEMNEAAGRTRFILEEAAGADFDVFERDETFLGNRNTGTVVPLPNAAAFEDLPTAPQLPTVP